MTVAPPLPPGCGRQWGDGWHFGAADGPNAAVVEVGWVVKFEGRLSGPKDLPPVLR